MQITNAVCLMNLTAMGRSEGWHIKECSKTLNRRIGKDTFKIFMHMNAYKLCLVYFLKVETNSVYIHQKLTKLKHLHLIFRCETLCFYAPM